MHVFATHNINNQRKISANRQVWLNSDTVDLTPAGRQSTAQQMVSIDSQERSRYRDDYATQKSQATIFDIIEAENIESRKIANALRNGDKNLVAELLKKESSIKQLNDILKISNLNFHVSIEAGGKVCANRAGDALFSITELSDGERNALLIVANVLTAPENTLILLDEPERHLHRSIVSPLITTLLEYRNDCAFVVSTHDISLPIDQVSCSVLLVRSYTHRLRSWEADYIKSIENFNELDDGVALAILGSRRKLLFIEGLSSSLDLQLYQILFPGITIKPLGSCVDVERVVKGLRATAHEHWVTAFGIVDKDNRTDADCQKFSTEGIFPLEQYSVESLYYHPVVIKKLLKKITATTGENESDVYLALTTKIIDIAKNHKNRLAARMIERKFRDLLTSRAPDWKKIQSSNVVISESTESMLVGEKQMLDDILLSSDIEKIISRYPMRETEALTEIAKALSFKSCEKYEHAVRKMLIDDEGVRGDVIRIIEPIAAQLS
jgi:AAA domain, putative AbiEii toxin, Type IV TA system